MKTFKLVELLIVDYESETYETVEIPLIDGLIINREDKENRWLVEAYVNGEWLDYFESLREKYEQLIIHVRITTKVNDLATCISSIIDINAIGDNMNVLLLGTMVNRRTATVEKILQKLKEEGEKGEGLLSQLKKEL